jgi:hypothetical protein
MDPHIKAQESCTDGYHQTHQWLFDLLCAAVVLKDFASAGEVVGREAHEQQWVDALQASLLQGELGVLRIRQRDLKPQPVLASTLSSQSESAK